MEFVKDFIEAYKMLLLIRKIRALPDMQLPHRDDLPLETTQTFDEKARANGFQGFRFAGDLPDGDPNKTLALEYAQRCVSYRNLAILTGKCAICSCQHPEWPLLESELSRSGWVWYQENHVAGILCPSCQASCDRVDCQHHGEQE
jgi:hypothetical protein